MSIKIHVLSIVRLKAALEQGMLDCSQLAHSLFLFYHYPRSVIYADISAELLTVLETAEREGRIWFEDYRPYHLNDWLKEWSLPKVDAQDPKTLMNLVNTSIHQMCSGQLLLIGGGVTLEAVEKYLQLRKNE